MARGTTLLELKAPLHFGEGDNGPTRSVLLSLMTVLLNCSPGDGRIIACARQYSATRTLCTKVIHR